MTKNRTIAKECFYEIGTAIEDKKSEAELIEIAKNFANMGKESLKSRKYN